MRRSFSDFEKIKNRINDEAKEILLKMEQTGGEPDVVYYDEEDDKYWIIDTSKESPSGRRSLCYDKAAHESRKKDKPRSSAEKVAEEIGIKILNEDEYRLLQSVGEFDLKSSSWIDTPEYIRSLGGSLFGDKRYDTVFIYHNGCESYYAARGFRGILKI